MTEEATRSALERPSPEAEPTQKSTLGSTEQAVNGKGDRPRPVMWAAVRLQRLAPEVFAKAARLAIRTAYNVLNRYQKSLTCTNYGWATLDGDGIRSESSLTPSDERSEDRLRLQLYERVAADRVAGQTVLEIGCGRGGGATFLRRALGARDVIGVDITRSSVQWARKHWSEPGVRFEVGDAENLGFADGCFEAVINVESAHNYAHVDRFLHEVYRVLRPSGVLLMADLGPTGKMQDFVQEIRDAGFELDEDEDITKNVVRALSIRTPEWEAWAAGRLPGFLRGPSREWAAIEGTGVYKALVAGDMTYRRFVARKP